MVLKWTCTGVLACAMLNAQESRAWKRLRDIPEPHIFEVAATIGSKIYLVASGEDGKRGGEVWAYDPASDEWQKKAASKIVRHSFGAADCGGKIYIWGGIADRQLTGAAEVYDPANDTWRTLPSMARPRMFAKGACVAGKLYAVGGIIPPGRNQVPMLDQYDPVANRWSVRADMPAKRDAYRVAAVRGTIYVVGNLNGSTEVLGYDPGANRWKVLAEMGVPRFDFGTVAWKDTIYTFGGMGSDVVEAYIPAKNVWVRKPPMPRDNWCQVVAEAHGRFYMFGGGFPARNLRKTVWLYDPTLE